MALRPSNTEAGIKINGNVVSNRQFADEIDLLTTKRTVEDSDC